MNLEGAAVGGANDPATVILFVRDELLRSALFEVLGRSARFVPLLAADFSEAFQLAEKSGHAVLVVELKAQYLDNLKLPPETRRFCRTLALCERPDGGLFARLIEAGAKGCISMEDSIEIFLEAIEELSAGGTYFPAAFLRKNAQAATVPLTGREREIIGCVARGFTSRMIATELRIGERSVETYRYRLMKKLGVRNAAALVEYAVRNGMSAVAGTDESTHRSPI